MRQKYIVDYPHTIPQLGDTRKWYHILGAICIHAQMQYSRAFQQRLFLKKSANRGEKKAKKNKKSFLTIKFTPFVQHLPVNRYL
jgi:hypothetical protein